MVKVEICWTRGNLLESHIGGGGGERGISYHAAVMFCVAIKTSAITLPNQYVQNTKSVRFLHVSESMVHNVAFCQNL